MSWRSERGELSGSRRNIFVVASVVAVVGIFALLPLVAKPRTEARELVLVAKGMTFYVDGELEPNPTIHVKRGQEIRLVFRNEEPGITHDFAVPDLRVAVRPLRGDGSRKLKFRAPAQPGIYRYLCNPHAEMMTGTIEVE